MSRLKCTAFFISLSVGLSLIGCTTNQPSALSNQQPSQNEVQEKTSWIRQEGVIDSGEFEFLSSKDVNLWPSFSDRSRVVGKVTQGDTVFITDYDSENDYCKVKKASIEGWIACGWIR